MIPICYDGVPIPNAKLVFEDSYYVPQFLQSMGMDPATMYDEINERAPWVDRSDPNMAYRGRTLPRTKAFWTRADAATDLNNPPAAMASYGYTGRQNGTLLEYRPMQQTPIIQQLANSLEKLGTRVNHAIATRYDDATDSIGYHSDKVRDFVPNSSILSVSLGCAREMHIGRREGKKMVLERTFLLGPGDLFVLGPRTNALHQHAIPPVKDERGPRISIVYRHIQTMVSLEQAKRKAAASERARAKRKRERDAPKKKGEGKRKKAKE